MKNLDFEWLTDEFMLYCRSTQLREKTMSSYEQTLRKNDSQGNLFKNLIIEMLELYPYADNRRATDDSEMIMDWNPNGGGTMRQQILDDTIEGIKFMNRKLGFSNSLFGRMADTTAAMGMQSEENDDFIVTWSFNSYSGLEVIYSKK